MIIHLLENIGVNSSLTRKERIRIRTINRLNIICVFFCLIYELFFTIYEMWIPCFATILLTQIFILSVYFNYIQKFLFAKIAVIISTNLGVLFFGLYLGFDSGVHIVNMTAPLIVFLIFDFNEKLKIKLALLLYTSNITIQIVTHKFHLIESVTSVDSAFYIINIIASFLLLTVLTYYFSSINNTINLDLKTQNLVLENTLNEKDLLLIEVHHRVKNNLAVISGLISLQAYSVDDEVVQKELLDTQRRIKSMSLIHENLYSEEKFIGVDFEQHIHKLTQEFGNSFSKSSKLKFIISDNHHKTNINTSISLSLLVNEILNYLISKQDNLLIDRVIKIDLIKEIDSYILRIIDNGFDEKHKNNQSNDSFYIELMNVISSQIGGRMTMKIDLITEFSVKFPVK